MAIALALIVGFLGARLAWLLLRPTFRTPVFARQNYRGHTLPTAAGMVLAVAVITVEAVRAVATSVVDGVGPADRGRLAVVIVVLGLALLGLTDDLAGDGDARGFRGHLAAAGRGKLSTGGLKLAGGAAISLVGVAVVRPSSGPGWLVADGALVALAANLGNLLDRAPGRTIKVSLLSFTALVLAAVVFGPRPATDLAAPAVVAGAALALLRDDLHERLMLGDAGANVLGGILGIAVVITAGPTARLATLAGVLVLNVLSEFVSFSRVIEGVPPLRLLDRAGRRLGA